MNRLVFLIIINTIFYINGSSLYALSGQEHVSLSTQYISGITTEEMKIIHSKTVDTLPWATKAGGFKHRELWGHTDDWFFKGRIPKDKVLKDIMNKQGITRNEAIKEMKRCLRPGREIIADNLQGYYPTLTRAESLSLAEQLHYSHKLGDCKTTEGQNISKEEIKKAKFVTTHPRRQAINGMNKAAIINAQKNQVSVEAFIRQPANFERAYIMILSKDLDAQIFNPELRGAIGIVRDGKNYLFASNFKRALHYTQKGYHVIVPDDVYSEMKKKNTIKPSIKPISSVNNKITTQKDATQSVKTFYTRLAREENVYKLKQRQALIKKMKISVPKVAGTSILVSGLSHMWNVYQSDEDAVESILYTCQDAAIYTASIEVSQALIQYTGDKYAITKPFRTAFATYGVATFIFDESTHLYYLFTSKDISPESFAVESGKSIIKSAAAGGAAAYCKVITGLSYGHPVVVAVAIGTHIIVTPIFADGLTVILV